jgi:hypothetical protein
MSDDFELDVRELWQKQPREHTVSIEEFRAHVYRFDRNMRLLYAVSCVALFVALAGDPWDSSSGYFEIALTVRNGFLMNVGWAMVVAALVYVAHQAREYWKWLSAPAALGLSASAGSPILPSGPRQDISTHPWRYLLAYVPGAILVLLAFTVDLRRTASIFIAVAALTMLAGIVWFNKTAAPDLSQPADPR